MTVESLFPNHNAVQSRFKILDYPHALPCKCVVCGSGGGDGRKFVDFGFDLDYYGVVYFCTTCFTEPLNIQGWLSPPQVETIKAEMSLQETRLSEMEYENVRLRGALSQLDFLGTCSCHSDNGPKQWTSEPENTGSTKQANNGPAKSSDVKGFPDLSGNDSSAKPAKPKKTGLAEFGID